MDPHASEARHPWDGGPRRVEPVFAASIRAMDLWVRARFDIRVEGLWHIPGAGPVLLAPNHVSYADPVVMGALAHRAGRRLRAVAIASVFEVFFVGWVLRRSHQIPIDRNHSRPALETARNALRGGEAVLLYPEGSIVRGGERLDARAGVGLLALDSRVPVIPVASAGLEPLQRRSIARRRAGVVIGPPVDLSAVRQERGRHAARRAATVVLDTVRSQLPAARDLAGLPARA